MTTDLRLRLIALLERTEWSASSSGGECPICSGRDHEGIFGPAGHERDCELAACLALLRQPAQLSDEALFLRRVFSPDPRPED